ncbi:SUMF1/EgtB/PvdO family nonheme iron enzyme [bacterium]|nr:SUMF1/EgtB/PvdO family nonheme iron enzyme [bacterium]
MRIEQFRTSECVLRIVCTLLIAGFLATNSQTVTAAVPADKTPLLPGGVELPLILVRAPRGSDEGTGITRDFYMSQFEITNGQWQALMGSTPTGESGAPESPDFLKPATNMTQDEAVNFAKALGDYLRAEYPEDFAGAALATPDQWEYAYAAGTTTDYYWGDDPRHTAIGNYAWFEDNANGVKQPVGGKLPNDWGLFDMSGNVAEWTTYRYQVCTAPNPPWEPDGHWESVCHAYGGSCDTEADSCTGTSWESLYLNDIVPDCFNPVHDVVWQTRRSDFIGLRVVVFPGTPSPSRDPEPPSVVFDFTGSREGWKPFGWPPFDAPVFSSTIGDPGTLNMTAVPSSSLVGIWESPAFEIAESNATLRDSSSIRLTVDRADGSTIFKASCRVLSDQNDASVIPTFRIRMTTQNAQQSDVLVVESNAGGAYSPRQIGSYYDLYFSPPATSSIFELYFDMLNFYPEDSNTATLKLDRVSIAPLSDSSLSQSRVERVYDFANGTDGWQHFDIPGLFDSPEFSYDSDGQRLAVSPSDSNEYQFGFWGSSLDPENNVLIEPGRMYYGIFTVASDYEDPQMAPSFRLRMNESLFRAGRYTVVSPTGQALNTPTLGESRQYTVYFPPNLGVGESLVESFDMLADPEHQLLDPDGYFFLESVEIRSAPTEATIMLPGDVPLTFAPIPSGSFLMGRYPGEQDTSDFEAPQHEVTLDYSYYMGRFELTKGQWKTVMGTEPWTDQETAVPHYANQPATYISWDDAQEFIARLNDYIDATNQGTFRVRLPSESEWEYACRAGTTTRFYWGDDPRYEQIDLYAWYRANIGEYYAHVIGQKQPNPWGLFDMSGNVGEWCQDHSHFSYTGAPPDGSAWEEGSMDLDLPRCLRGYGFLSMSHLCRSAFRYPYCCISTARREDIGVRLAGYWDIGEGAK